MEDFAPFIPGPVKGAEAADGCAVCINLPATSKSIDIPVQRTFHRCFLPSFISFAQTVSEEILFQKSTNQKQEFSLGACLLTDQNEMNNLYREHSIDASYQVSVHLAKLFLRKTILEIDQSRHNNCLWRPCLLMDRYKTSSFY